MNISIYRSIANQYNHLRAVNTVSMMNTISHQIEEQVKLHRLPVDFYAGFQHFSRFPAQLRRYSQLGLVCRRVYVFGVPDVRPPLIQGVEFIELEPDSPLAQEWFLLVDTPDFWTLLSTQEKTNRRDMLSGGRAFEGLWSFDTQVAERASELLAQATGRTFEPVRQRNYERQNLHIAEMNGRLIEMMERSRVSTQRRWKQISTLHKITEALVRQTQLPLLLNDVARTLHMILGASGVAIALHGDYDQYTLASGEGESAPRGTVVKPGEGPSGRAILEAGLVHVRDVRQSRERDLLLPVASNVLSAPMLGKLGVYGVIAVGDSDPNRWNDDDAKTLMAAAVLLASAIESRSGIGSESVPDSGEQLREPLAYMMQLHHKLRDGGDLSTTQRQLLDRVMRLSMELAQTVGVPGSLVARLVSGETTRSA
jgi:uncharacterized protein YigA (DUF484 family)